MHAALRCTEETMSTDICIMDIDYIVWVYILIPDIKYDLSDIVIWSRLRFDPVS